MKPLASAYIRLAVLYSIIGMGVGLMMVSIDDHGQMPTHAHIMLIGFVSTFLFGGFYRMWPEAEAGILPKLHFILFNASFIGFMVGFWIIYDGDPDLGEYFTAPSTTILFFSQFIFGWIVYRATKAKP